MADKNYQLDFTMTDGSVKSVVFTAPEGPEGPQGPAGGYYLPSVQMSPDYGKEEDTMLVLFTPSKEEMPRVLATEITLPRGPQGYSGPPGAKGLGIYRLNKALAGSAEYCYSGEFTFPEGNAPGLGDMVLTDDSYLAAIVEVDETDGWKALVALMYDSRGNLVRLKGADGPEGPQGDKGDPGPQGPEGKAGFAPLVEVSGYGEVGPDDVERTGYEVTVTDVNGSKTFVLLNGAEGHKGDKGDQGDKGDTGATGSQGPKGDKGDTGPEGPQGPKGDKGDTGATGSQGPKGDKGDTGATGSQGPKGDPGKTAYAYAQEGGYQGTEAEFSQALADAVSKEYSDEILSPTDLEGSDVSFSCDVDVFDRFIPGHIYRVTVNGTNYYCKAVLSEDNLTIMLDTEEFTVNVDKAANGYHAAVYFMSFGSSYTHVNLAIYGEGEAQSKAPLTFTGAVSGIYDGSGPVTINVPTIAGPKGDKGDKGDQGDPGKDGVDATVTADSIENALGYVPADVNDVFELTTNPQFTNIFDTVDVEYGKILNIETGEVTDVSANLATTDFIPCKANDVFRVNEDFPIYNSGNPAFVMYDSNKAYLKGIKSNAAAEDGYYVKTLERDENGYITAFQVIRPSATGYIRICNNTTVIGKNPILTINEEIVYENGYGAKLNPKVRVDQSQIVNAPNKNGWSILPYERLNIAYSSIGRKPINTVEHFTDAATNFGYNVLKCDVRPTSDGELVCCHDAGFTFDGSGYITTYSSANQTVIHDVTAATVLGYSFRTGEHPCLVGDYLDVCRKYGKVAFITIRNEYMDVVVPKLLEELKIHNMTYATIINCMTYNSLVTWRTYDQNVMINYTLNAGVAIDQKEIDRAIGLGYCSLCGFGLNSSVLEPNHTCDFEYARANGVRLLQAIAYKDGSPEDCYAMGYDGCQIAYPWNPVTVLVDAYTKSETENLIATAIGGAIGGSY